MIEHRAPISGIAAFEDKYIATAGYDNEVILWDAHTKRALSRGVHDHLANQCRFSSDGRFLVSSSSDYTARIWAVPSMRLVAVLADHEDDVEAVAFHPTKPLIATASRDAKVRVFDLSGRLVRVMTGHAADVISVEWMMGKDELVTSSDDGTVKRWDLNTGSLIEDYVLGDVETDTVVVTELGVIFAGNDDGEIIRIGADRQTVKAHNAGIKRLVYNQDNHALVSLSYDRKVRVWRLAGGTGLTLVAAADLPSVVWPRSVAFSGPDVLAFATFGSSYAELHIPSLQWRLEGISCTHGINAVLDRPEGTYTVGDAGIVCLDGKPLRTLPSLCNFLTGCGSTILTGGQTGQVFNALTGEVIYQHRSPLNCSATFIGNGRERSVIGTYTGEGIVLARVEDTVQFECLVPMHKNAVKSVAADAGQIFSVSADASMAVHSADSLALVQYVDCAHDKIANGCASLGNGYFASIGRDLKLRIWCNGEAKIVATPHENSIKCIAASNNKEYLATGSYGGRVAIFHVPTETWVMSLRVTAAGISSLVPSCDGQEFLAGSYDGRIYRVTPQSDLKAGCRHGR